MSQDFLSVLEGLKVDENDIREAEIMAVNYLQPLYPTLDLREGTGLRDTSIRASATLIALLRKGLTYYFTINSLDNATEQTPEGTIDSILSNFFVSRKQGSNSTVRARLYFTARRNISISTSLFFSPDNERFFYPKQTSTFTVDNMLLDASRNQYYVEVDLESESEGDEYNISTGPLLFFSTFDPFFVGAEILLLVTKSVSKETNSEFIERSGTAISTRNLINAPSVDFRIREEFTAFRSITTVGMGDRDMLRDLVTVLAGTPAVPTQVHVGGHVDVYVESDIDIIEEEFTIQQVDEGVVLEGEYSGIFDIEVLNITFDGNVLPYPNFEYETVLDGYNLAGEPVEPSKDLGLSAQQKTTLKFREIGGAFNPDWNLGTALIRMKKVHNLDSLQSFFDNSLARVICANLLARAYEPVSLNVNIATHTPVGLAPSEVRTRLETYVTNINAAGLPFVVSEALEVLDVDNVVLPSGSISSNATFFEYTVNYRNMEKTYGTIPSIKTLGRLQRFFVDKVTLNGVE